MLAHLAIVAAAIGLASAQSVLQILAPGGSDLWWVAQSENNIVWTCHENTALSNFTILVANSNQNVLVSPEAIIAIQPNFDCSETITTQQANLPVASGYTVQFANPFNSSDIYAQSAPFEIKALGATYPAASATPTESGVSSTGSGTATSSGSSSSSTSKSAAYSVTPQKFGVLGVVAGLAALAF